MSALVPCEACARHVRSDARDCPFCGAAISARPIRAGTTVRRVTRAAIFYLGATIAGCDDDSQVAIYGGPPEPEPETIMQPYGAPPEPPPEIVEPEGPTLPPEDPPVAQPYGAPPMEPDEGL